MNFSLYAATVPSYLQMLGSVRHLIEKAQSHCAENKLDPAELSQARLAPDMLPFSFQIGSVAVHSRAALEGALSGRFAPDFSPAPADFPALIERVAGAIAHIEAIDAAALDARLGREVVFEHGSHRMDFIAEDFLLSFSQPNFYFHASTAYGILRMKGVKIGKRDFTGAVRTKR